MPRTTSVTPYTSPFFIVSKTGSLQRLSAKTNLKLAKLWLDRKEYGRLSKLIRDLHTATLASSDADDQSQRGTQLLEIYALEIQMYNETKNFKKLKVGHA